MRPSCLPVGPVLAVMILVAGCAERTSRPGDGSGISPGRRQLASSLGLDPALYSLNELVQIRHEREDDDD